MSVTTCQIYGVVAKVSPDGEIVVCEPVFNAISRKAPKTKKLYKAKWTSASMPNRPNLKLIEDFEEFDISGLGTPLFLPISKAKVNDGKEHLIIYQDSKSLPIDRSGIVKYRNSPVVTSLKSNDFWVPTSVTVGIRFPDKFITVMLGGLSSSELKELLDASYPQK